MTDEQFVQTPEFLDLAQEFGVSPSEDAAADLTGRRREEFCDRYDALKAQADRV